VEKFAPSNARLTSARFRQQHQGYGGPRQPDQRRRIAEARRQTPRRSVSPAEDARKSIDTVLKAPGINPAIAEQITTTAHNYAGQLRRRDDLPRVEQFAKAIDRRRRRACLKLAESSREYDKFFGPPEIKAALGHAGSRQGVPRRLRILWELFVSKVTPAEEALSAVGRALQGVRKEWNDLLRILGEGKIPIIINNFLLGAVEQLKGIVLGIGKQYQGNRTHHRVFSAS